MSEAFNEVLGELGKGAPAVAQSRVSPASPTNLEKQAVVTQANSDMLPAFKEATAHVEKREEELRTQPSPLASQDAAADQAMRLDPLKSQGFGADFSAAAEAAFQTNLTMSAWQAWTKDRPEFKVDPNFDWAAVRNEVVGKYGPEHEGKLERARSAEELKSFTDELDRLNRDQAAMGRSFTGSVAGSLADPLTLFFGIGEAKGLHSMWKGMQASRMSKVATVSALSGVSGAGIGRSCSTAA